MGNQRDGLLRIGKATAAEAGISNSTPQNLTTKLQQLLQCNIIWLYKYHK